MKKYKVGDQVIINSLKWYKSHEENDDISSNGVWFTPDMAKYCGVSTRIVSIVGGYKDNYFLECDGGNWYWSEEWIKGIKEIRRKKLEKLYENI